jgi:hypothetical protein
MAQILAWICLALVASTSAYGLQLAAEATLSSAGTAPQATATSTRNILIVAIDPATGDRSQVECEAPASSFASDVVLVHANDFSSVAQACSDADAAELGR